MESVLESSIDHPNETYAWSSKKTNILLKHFLEKFAYYLIYANEAILQIQQS